MQSYNLNNVMNVRLVTAQLRNNCNYFFYLSMDDEHRVWGLVMDNSVTNIIIFIYPRMMSMGYGRAISRWLWTTP